MPTQPVAKIKPDAATAAQPVTNAEKARALIAMLEKTDSPSDVPPERLRDWASDLIRTVEGEKKTPGEAPVTRRRRLFTKAPPKLSPAPLPPSDRPEAERQGSRLTLSAPMPHSPAAPPRASQPTSPSTYTPVEVRKIMDATVDPATLGREHPAIIAMTLMGKPSLEQAASLRNLPGGQVRAVHKALRQLEFSISHVGAQTSSAPQRSKAISE